MHDDTGAFRALQQDAQQAAEQLTSFLARSVAASVHPPRLLAEAAWELWEFARSPATATAKRLAWPDRFDPTAEADAMRRRELLTGALAAASTLVSDALTGARPVNPDTVNGALNATEGYRALITTQVARDAMGRDVGIALNLQPARPATEDPGDVRAARLADLHMNRLFLDPLFGRGYPAELAEHYRPVSDMRFVHDGDLEVIAGPLDFLGVNYYRRHTVTAGARSELGADQLPGSLGAWSVPPPGVELTAMGWPVEPQALTDLLIELHRDYGPARLIVTENGAAFDDEPAPDGIVHDARRIAFLRDHIAAARAALEARVPVAGFLVWSLLDNFEWAEGYSKRFGLVHVDFASQVRIPKESAAWYAEVIRRQGVPAGLG
jgi:beta-glucosidase/6-phospho-beta-glucosidase/beta-galactosidase